MESENSLIAQFRALEMQLLPTDVQNSRAELSLLIADDFIEYGSSGHIWRKQQIVEYLFAAPKDEILLEGLHAKYLAAEVVLVTYQAARTVKRTKALIKSLRSSLWKVLDGRWQIVFHQGTSIPPTFKNEDAHS